MVGICDPIDCRIADLHFGLLFVRADENGGGTDQSIHERIDCSFVRYLFDDGKQWCRAHEHYLDGAFVGIGSRRRACGS